MHSDSGKSTHSGPSNAGQGASHDIKQGHSTRIGQWPTGTISANSTSSVALKTHNSTRRTGTDLHIEEINIGGVRSRTCSIDSTQVESEAARAPQPHGTSVTEKSAVTGDPGMEPHD